MVSRPLHEIPLSFLYQLPSAQGGPRRGVTYGFRPLDLKNRESLFLPNDPKMNIINTFLKGERVSTHSKYGDFILKLSRDQPPYFDVHSFGPRPITVSERDEMRVLARDHIVNQLIKIPPGDPLYLVGTVPGQSSLYAAKIITYELTDNGLAPLCQGREDVIRGTMPRQLTLASQPLAIRAALTQVRR